MSHVHELAQRALAREGAGPRLRRWRGGGRSGRQATPESVTRIPVLCLSRGRVTPAMCRRVAVTGAWSRGAESGRGGQPAVGWRQTSWCTGVCVTKRRDWRCRGDMETQPPGAGPSSGHRTGRGPQGSMAPAGRRAPGRAKARRAVGADPSASSVCLRGLEERNGPRLREAARRPWTETSADSTSVSRLCGRAHAGARGLRPGLRRFVLGGHRGDAEGGVRSAGAARLPLRGDGRARL